ncbi:hypothetical protein PRIC1_014668 [Phytophthora ramorum]
MLRPIEISAAVAVIGRCVIAPLLLVLVFGATNYLSTAKFFIGPADSYFAYSQLDPVMHGGCSGCVCSCRKVLMQLSAFGSDAVLSKPTYEDLQASATEAVAAGDYSRLSPEALALADQLDANGAVCSTGVNDWGTPNVVLADGPEGVLAVITTLKLSLSPQMLRELEVAVERKEECVSRWNIGILLRLFKFQNVKNSLDYSSVPVADVITFPHYTDCRPDILNDGIVGEKLVFETHGEDLLAVVPDILKLFPYQFTSSLPSTSRYIPAKNTIYGVKNVTQPLFKGYYAGCRVRVVNTTGVYVEDTCTLLKHWIPYGLMLQAPDDLPLTSTMIAFAGLSSLRLTSLAFIGEQNGELLRRTSVRGAKYCGLNDSCYVFTVNLVFVVATLSFTMGFVANLGAIVEKRVARSMQLTMRRGATIHITPQSSSAFKFSNKVGPQMADLQRLKLTTFEENCLGGQFTRLFYDCEDFAYVTFRGKRCTTVEALLLTGYLFYGQHVYQATSVVLLLVARVMPRKVIRTFNVLLIRWRIDPDEGTLSHALSCSWYGASAERFTLAEAVPVS